MFDEIIKLLKKSPPEIVEQFLPRIDMVVDEARGTGYGYHDYLSYAIEEAYPAKDSPETLIGGETGSAG